MVKVQVEGYGETPDYIPLFYHPKPQYWDGEEVKATDFDEEQGCHKRAWMSFRCTDEVVVLMEAEKDSPNLTPKYVIGFVDNYPRIGENIFKIDCESYGWYHMSSYGNIIKDQPSVRRTQHFQVFDYEQTSVLFWKYGEENEEVNGQDGNPLGLDTEIEPVNVDYQQEPLDIAWNPDYMEGYYLYYYFKYLIPIGPFLLILQIFYKYENVKLYGTYQGTKTLWSEWRGVDDIYVGSAYAIINTQENIDLASESQKNMTQRIAREGGTAFDVYDDCYYMLSLDYWINFNLGNMDNYYQYKPDWTSAKIFVRPHTKEELIQAGLLNSDGSLP